MSRSKSRVHARLLREGSVSGATGLLNILITHREEDELHYFAHLVEFNLKILMSG